MDRWFLCWLIWSTVDKTLQHRVKQQSCSVTGIAIAAPRRGVGDMQPVLVFVKGHRPNGGARRSECRHSLVLGVALVEVEGSIGQLGSLLKGLLFPIAQGIPDLGGDHQGVKR